MPTPQYSRNSVNKAGRILVKNIVDLEDFDDYFWAFDVVSNWRACHAYPINTFQATLRTKLKSLALEGIVAQRLKRMPSIISKLNRFDKMQLSRMQDIGGLRAVVKSMSEVTALETNYLSSKFKHELVSKRDYIQYPKISGYRSIHFIYRYNNNLAPQYNGLLLELQIRSRLQHIWATSVETMGTFLNQALKSSEGEKEWLDFFALVSASFAHMEKTKVNPGFEQFTEIEINEAVLRAANRLDVERRLIAFTIATDRIYKDNQKGSYHLIVLNPKEMSVNISSFGQLSFDEATKKYSEIEKRIQQGENLQAVLVAAGSMDNLKRAYPNYFLDTRQFVYQLRRIRASIEDQKPSPHTKYTKKHKTKK